MRLGRDGNTMGVSRCLESTVAVQDTKLLFHRLELPDHFRKCSSACFSPKLKC